MLLRTNRHNLIVLLRPAVSVIKICAAAVDAELGARRASGAVVEEGEVFLRACEAQRVVQHLTGQGACQGVLALQNLYVDHVGGLKSQSDISQYLHIQHVGGLKSPQESVRNQSVSLNTSGRAPGKSVRNQLVSLCTS